MNFLIENNLPFNIVESASFKALVDPTGDKKLKHRTWYASKILGDVYDGVKSKIEMELETCQNLSFTFDGWSGPKDNFMRLSFLSFYFLYTPSYLLLSLTAEGISKKWIHKKFILAMVHFPQSHTGRNVAFLISDLMKQWKVFNKACGFVTDGGSNMIKVC